jgi:hypothetical protein
MSKSLHKGVALASAAALLLGPVVPAAAQMPSVAEMQAAKRAVARITARNCAGGVTRAATAFLWPDTQHVVTARHVVAGCSKLSLIFSGGAPFTATPVRELRSRDLVLLKLDHAATLTPLQIGNGTPPVNSRVAAIGYALGAPTADSKLLDVTLANLPPGSKLEDMLDDKFSQKIMASGELNLQTLVLRLDGNLLPGLSGAPLIGHDGLVYGVGSGGLQEGAGGVVWAVRGAYVTQLPAGSVVASVGALQRSSGLSFADQSPQSNVMNVTCGAMTLSRSRTVRLSDIVGDSDDQIGLMQLSAGLGQSFPAIAQLEFDVWVDPASGATIVVPDGATLTDNGSQGCSAHVGNGVDLVVTGADIPDNGAYNSAAQQYSMQLEGQLGALFPVPMMNDPSFTYPVANIRAADQFAVRRVAFSGPRPAPGGMIFADYAFLTHLVRGTRYVGVGATRRGLLVNPALIANCNFMPASPPCVAARQTFSGWTKAAIAVHLATMPPI